ncbi:Rieske [2Fe-2S] domain-containing protein [Klenkia brasiliensis]|uniref:Rieske [2Fe-2S] domain-containing protein n=1 Tax=Klenkia brasiliensis TaxID=333142 RepID=A0A1G7ZCY7_9ACTN|nr:Rieske [2Fe-2S] domain-containing protein [Klenkia brasiliensis]
MSVRCRHQLADLSAGSVDADGCLVCPWHRSRHDVRSGEMVDGPRGSLALHGPVPGCSGLVRLLGRVLPLRVRRAVRRGADVHVEGE